MLKSHTNSRVIPSVVHWRWPLLMVGALLIGLTVIFPQVGLLQWVVLVPAFLIILVRCPDPNVRLRTLYGMGVVFFLLYYLVTFHWFLYMYPLSFAGIDKAAAVVVVAVAWLGLSGFQAVGAALIFPLMGLACRGKYLSRLPVVHPFLFAALWAAWEWFQANSGWSGVPWGRLPLGQAETLITLQCSAYFSSYFVTFLILAINGLLACLILHATRRLLCGVTAGALFMGNLVLGGIRYLTVPEPGETVTVAAIQGNMSSHDEWSFSSLDQAIETYDGLTRAAVAEGAELVVWPETVIPSNIDKSDKVYDFVTALAHECEVPILVGVFTSVEEGNTQEYNSIVVALPDGTLHETVYNKRNPVPFGEFVPFRDLVMTLVPPLAEISILGEDIPPGEESVVFDLDMGMVGSAICFDSIYEANTLDSVKNGAELIAVSTNDSWFRDSRGVWMHHAQSQLRAIETGRYIVRAANTGVSSLITPTGEIIESLGALLDGYIIGEVALCTETTPYVAIGNVFAYLCVAFGGVWILLASVERIRDRMLSSKK